MNKMSNPFVVTKSIPEALFCDREEETAFLVKQVVNGRNVVIMSPRRMGKTQLIYHLFEQNEIKEHYRTFYVDIYSATSLQEMCYLFGKSVFEQLKSKKQQHWEGLFQILKSLRPAFKIDQITGEPSFELGIGTITSPETTLEEIFAYLEASPIPCIVAFDEFQQIAEFGDKRVEALLRGMIQKCSNTTFLFSGSKRHSISLMFHSKARPFYQSAQMMDLNPLRKDVYTDFSTRLFCEYGKELMPEVVSAVYDEYDGTTWYMQMLMNELFAMTKAGERCQQEAIPQALRNIIEVQDGVYRTQLSLLSVRQKGVLQAIAREGVVKSPTSAAFIKSHSLDSASSVQSALKVLLNDDTVTHYESGYRVSDYFFAQWLRVAF